MSEKEKTRFLKQVLSILKNENKGEIGHILLQKFIYFLDYINYNKCYSFKPHTYGPYSPDLASELKIMEYNDEIKYENNDKSNITFGDNFIPIITCTETNDKIKNYYTDFKKLCNENLSFRNIEILGTLLYCINTLKHYSKDTDNETVINEFRGWKGTKYSYDEINSIYSNLKSSNNI